MAARKKTAKKKTAATKKTTTKKAGSAKTTTTKRSPAPRKAKGGAVSTGLVYASALREMIARRLGRS